MEVCAVEAFFWFVLNEEAVLEHMLEYHCIIEIKGHVYANRLKQEIKCRRYHTPQTDYLALLTVG